MIKKSSVKNTRPSIDGEWENPISKNRYFFYSNPSEPTKLTISILQNSSKEPIMVNALLNRMNDKMRLHVEGLEHNIEFIENWQGQLLEIRMPSGEKIRLIKSTPVKTNHSLASFSIQ